MPRTRHFLVPLLVVPISLGVVYAVQPGSLTNYCYDMIHAPAEKTSAELRSDVLSDRVLAAEQRREVRLTIFNQLISEQIGLSEAAAQVYELNASDPLLTLALKVRFGERSDFELAGLSVLSHLESRREEPGLERVIIRTRQQFEQAYGPCPWPFTPSSETPSADLTPPPVQGRHPRAG